MPPAAAYRMGARKTRDCPWCRADWADMEHFASCTKLPEKLQKQRPPQPADTLARRLAWPMNQNDRKDPHGTASWGRFLSRLRSLLLTEKCKERYQGRPGKGSGKGKTGKTEDVGNGPPESEHREPSPRKTGPEAHRRKIFDGKTARQPRRGQLLRQRALFFPPPRLETA